MKIARFNLNINLHSRISKYIIKTILKSSVYRISHVIRTWSDRGDDGIQDQWCETDLLIFETSTYAAWHPIIIARRRRRRRTHVTLVYTCMILSHISNLEDFLVHTGVRCILQCNLEHVPPTKLHSASFSYHHTNTSVQHSKYSCTYIIYTWYIPQHILTWRVKSN